MALPVHQAERVSGSSDIRTDVRQSFVSESEPHHSGAMDKIFRYAGIASAAISISPLLLKSAGFGKDDAEFLSFRCCPIIEKNSFSLLHAKNGLPTYGIAGALSAVFERIPVVGGELSKGGIHNALSAGGLIVAGHYAGLGIDRLERKAGHEPRIGKWVKKLSQPLGVLIALPAILPGVGHGVMFLSTVTGMERMDKEHLSSTGPGSTLAGILGKVPGECKGEIKLHDAAKGSGSILIAQLCCALPAIIASLPLLFGNGKSEGKSL